MKKIVLVANSGWYIYNFRLDLIKDIKDAGYDLNIITPFDDYVKIIRNENYNHKEWKLSRKSINPIKEIKSIIDLIKIYKEIKPDIVHHFTIKSCLYGTIAAKISNVNNVVNAITGLGHVFVGRNITTKILRKALLPIYRIIFRSRRSNIIFQNEDDLQEFVKLKITKKKSSHLIQGSGVDTEKFSPSKKNIKISYNYPIKVLFPSRLIIEKGIIELIDACELLWQENFDFDLVIAGETNDSNRSSISEDKLEYIKNNKRIYCLGHVKDMKSLYEEVDIVVLPSWREGLSRALIEAASMEKPIITTNATGCTQIVDHGINGLLTPIRSAESLMLALKFLFNNPLLSRKFGINIRKKIIKNFRTSLINQSTLDFYSKLKN